MCLSAVPGGKATWELAYSLLAVGGRLGAQGRQHPWPGAVRPTLEIPEETTRFCFLVFSCMDTVSTAVRQRIKPLDCLDIECLLSWDRCF